MNKKQWLSWGVMLVVCIVVFLCVETLISAVPFIKNILDRLNLDGGMELFFAQTSLTFISISVLSMLSEKSIVIYWEDQIERKLINPLFGSFLSMTGYSFILLLFSFLSIIFVDGKDSYALALVYFLINIFVLCKLTFDMIGLYFNRNERMKKLQKMFRELYYEDNEGSIAYDSLTKDWKIIDTRINAYNLGKGEELEQLKTFLAKVEQTADEVGNSVSEWIQRLHYKQKKKEKVDIIKDGENYYNIYYIRSQYDSIRNKLQKKSQGTTEKSYLYGMLLIIFEKEFKELRDDLEKCWKYEEKESKEEEKKYRKKEEEMQKNEEENKKKFEKCKKRKEATEIRSLDQVNRFLADDRNKPLSEFEVCKKELLLRTIQYMQNGNIRELKENLHMVFMFFRFFEFEDFLSIAKNTPETLTELVYRELIRKMIYYRKFFGCERYWEMVFKYFSEDFNDLLYFFCDANASMLEKKREYGINERTVLQQCVYDMLQYAIMIMDNSLPKTYREIIVTVDWSKYIISNNLESELFIDAYRYLCFRDSVLVLRSYFDVSYYRSQGYDVNGYEKRNVKSACVVYLQGVKRILYRGEKEAARKEIKRVLNSLCEGGSYVTDVYSVYIEGVLSELEKEEPEKWNGYTYEDFKKDFNSVVNAAMKGKEMEGWRQLDEETKHKNLFFQYAYVADKEVSGSQIAKKREKVDIITRRIGDTMHFGDEIYCDEEGLRILLYAYYRGYIGDIDKVMTRFCYHNGENKRIYYTKEQILGPIKKRMNSENPKLDFLDKIAEDSKKE